MHRISSSSCDYDIIYVDFKNEQTVRYNDTREEHIHIFISNHTILLNQFLLDHIARSNITVLPIIYIFIIYNL